MLGWHGMGNLELDWLLISSVLGTIIFVATNLAVFAWLLRYKPEVLRTKGKGHIDTTFDWKVIGEIILQCGSFSGGLVLLLQESVFMVTGIWNLDAGSLGTMTLAFALMLFRSFDGFVTNLLKTRRK